MRALTLVTLVLVSGIIGYAATPPDYVNYQGVLRDASNEPLDGAHDMVFRLFSAETGGDEILVDRQTAVDSSPVVVTGGMFSAHLGAGAISDGSGPGTYGSLAEAFRDYGAVFLSVEVNGEVLDPRVRVISTPYAHNAATLQGLSSGDFINTSPSTQSKAGRLEAVELVASSVGTGVEGYGDTMGGYFADRNSSAIAYVASGDIGVDGRGHGAGGYFRDSNNSGRAEVGVEDYGIRGLGNFAGGYFKDLEKSGQARVGFEDRGIEAWGAEMGGYFFVHNASGSAQVATGHRGIEASGNEMGAHFSDANGTGQANVAIGNRGIEASGDEMGGHFSGTASSGQLLAAYGNRGIQASGSDMGGHFYDTDSSGQANVATGNRGIEAYGLEMGGYFEDSGSSGVAWVGYDHYGIQGYGDTAGGFFDDTNSSGYAYIASGNIGVAGYGNSAGGYFSDTTSTGLAYVGYGDRGIWGKGTFAGGTFSHPDNVTHWSDVSTSTHKIVGTGTVSFVQNHPYEQDKVIVYAAPEGDEVAVYTRGSARLENGEVRVRLGQTFEWVANPDIGLTAHVTPRGPGADLYVESVSTSELIVRGNATSAIDAEFDYIVYGLRLGFEQIAPVQMKQREAFVPTSEDVQQAYAGADDLRRFNALERFKAMRDDESPMDMSSSQSLVAAINERRGEMNTGSQIDLAETGDSNVRDAPRSGPAQAEPVETMDQTATAMQAHEASAHLAEMIESGGTWLPVIEPVEIGDVLALSPERSGALRRADSINDPHVVGIAAAASRETADGLEVNLAAGRYAIAKVDASYGAIRAGDLLGASMTPGHAMVGFDLGPGAVVGKALESLESGRGAIKVLVLLR